MASAAKLGATERKKIAAQTAAMLSLTAPIGTGKKPKAASAALMPKSAAAIPAMAEDFEYISIPLEAIVNQPVDLSGLLKPTGSHLHLIRSGKRATAFSVSDDKNTVRSVVRGTLAQKIFDAVRWLDSQDEDDNDDPACILQFPGLYVYALGIKRPSGPTAVVLGAPDSLKDIYDPTKFREMPLSDLLKRLQKHAQGMDFVKAGAKNAVYG